MMHSFEPITRYYSPTHRVEQWLARLCRGLTIVAALLFVFVSAVPAPALAASSTTAGSTQRLEFTWNVSLAGRPLSVDHWLAAGMTVVPQSLPPVPETIEVGDRFRVIATAYSSTIAQTDADPFTTASGTTVGPGTLAANFLPFGSKVKIRGTTYTVEDRLHARYNDRRVVDIWFESEEEALAWGVRISEMTIVSIPKGQ